MEDVDLLVEIFYKFEDEKNKERIEEELEELEGIDEMPEEERAILAEEIKRGGLQRKPTMNENVTDGGDKGEGEEEVDPNELTLEPEHVVKALQEFEEVREKKAIEDMMGASKNKKVNKAEDEDERKKREKLK